LFEETFMPSFSSILVPLRRPLAVPLDHLCRSLDSLGKDVREAIAQAVGQAVSEVLREAVRILLEEPARPQKRSSWAGSVPVRSPPSWKDRQEASWSSDPYALEDEGELFYGDAADDPYFRREYQPSVHPPR
jgi:hypothetical protein